MVDSSVVDVVVAVVVAVVVVVVVVAAVAVLVPFHYKPCFAGSWCWCRTGTCLAVDQPRQWDYAVPGTSRQS